MATQVGIKPPRPLDDLEEYLKDRARDDKFIRDFLKDYANFKSSKRGIEIIRSIFLGNIMQSEPSYQSTRLVIVYVLDQLWALAKGAELCIVKLTRYTSRPQRSELLSWIIQCFYPYAINIEVKLAI